MKVIDKNVVLEHLVSTHMTYDNSNGNIGFSGNTFTFRIPIGDYKLQLDFRINAAISMLPENGQFLICRREFNWHNVHTTNSPYESILQLMGIAHAEGAILFSKDEKNLLHTLVYLTNRWGKSQQDFYIIPFDSSPQVMLYVPYSPISIFVLARTLETHNSCFHKLTTMNIPAYGEQISQPIHEPVYRDIKIGTKFVKVDPRTGRPVGSGSEESVLLPQFLPPE